ncbi:MAG: lecithin retinol acyltransferase family protein, partial [Methylococcales bacterium]
IAGDVIGGTVDFVGDVAGGAVDIAGNVIGGTVDFVGDGIDFIKENPVKSAAIVAAIIARSRVIPTGGGIAAEFAKRTGDLTAGMEAKSLLGSTSEVIKISTEITKKEAASLVAAGFVAHQITTHIVDNYVREKINPVKGCIVYCDLVAVAEHSGVYIGDGKIVHLDGNGKIEVVTKKEFLNRLSGFNTAMSVYVSCSDNHAVGNTSVAERAIAMMSNRRNYNIILDNCHQFTSGCITGNFENSDNFWWMLKNTTEQHYAANSWRVWS